MRKVDLNRKVYNKDKFNKSIDTEFNEIIPPSDDIEEVAVEDVSDMELRALTYPALDAGL